MAARSWNSGLKVENNFEKICSQQNSSEMWSDRIIDVRITEARL